MGSSPWRRRARGRAGPPTRCAAAAGERAAALRRSAGRHRDAAEALAHHADEVDRVKDLIAAAERKVTRLLGDLGDLVDRFIPPPPGHRDWLRIEIPGLSS